ncbi:hypothetical protein M0802_012980, partial [Mischocyttarus mexicanus]
MDSIMIKHNPGMYIIEQSKNDRIWETMKISNSQFTFFSNLISNTSYRYRLRRLTKRGVSRSEISDWFTTYDVDYAPKKVTNVSLFKMEIDQTNVCQLSADIHFEPADAPEKVVGLHMTDIYKHDGLYDVIVNWDKPTKEPDNYTIQLETFRKDKILLTV